jgi:hypothetical protein
MAWLGLDRLLLGTSLDETQAQSDALDQKINAANQQLEASGYVKPGYADAAAQDIAAGNITTGADQVVASVNSEFVAGAELGLQNVLQAPGKVVGYAGQGLSTIVGGILKGIPWWIYGAALVALFVWAGGLELLRGRLTRR